MNRWVLVGLAAVAALAGAIFWSNRGAQIRIEGTVLKTRMQKLADNHTMLAFDFRFTNPADYPFVVRDVTVRCTMPDGETLAGETVSDDDARRVFEFYKLNLGEKFNESLVIKNKVPPKATEDRMIAATFAAGPERLAARTGCRIRVDDVDGAYSEIREIVK